MKIKYVGGRKYYEFSYNKKSYHFTPENNMILDIREKDVLYYIFSLSNRTEFEFVLEEPEINENPLEKSKVEFKCSVCGFISKSEQGNKVHFAKHKREELQ